MTATDYVPEPTGRCAEEALALLAGVVCFLKSGPIDGEALLDPLLNRVGEAIAKVRGNRPVGSGITYSDGRLVVAAALRLFLEELEGA